MKRNKYRGYALLLAVAWIAWLTGCGQPASGTDPTGSPGTATIPAPTAGTTAGTTAEGVLETGDMFTDRDREIGYSDADSIALDLNAREGTVTISEPGTYVLSGMLDGQILIAAGDTDKIHLVLDNARIDGGNGAALYVRSADKVFVTLAPDSENQLSNTDAFVAIDENNIDGVVFSKSDITFNGLGTLSIQSAYGHGIVSKDDLAFTGGTYLVTAAGHGLAGKDSIRIGDGTFSLDCGRDGLHAGGDEESEGGFLYVASGRFEIKADQDGMEAASILQIDGGDIQVAAGDDGLHAEGDLVIHGGDLTVSESYEGLEGETVTVAGGTIEVRASDDGINASAGGSGTWTGGRPPAGGGGFAADPDCVIRITGGVVRIDADGDGIDSNGSFEVDGGETYITGPTHSANGAVDYMGTGRITGGIFAAAGSAGMAQNFDDSSTQGAILYSSQEWLSAGTKATLSDAEGNQLVSYVPAKTYQTILVSAPGIEAGQTYTLSVGSDPVVIEMTGLLYGSGGGMPGGMPGGQPGGRPGQIPGGWPGSMPGGDPPSGG